MLADPLEAVLAAGVEAGVLAGAALGDDELSEELLADEDDESPLPDFDPPLEA